MKILNIPSFKHSWSFYNNFSLKAQNSFKGAHPKVVPTDKPLQMPALDAKVLTFGRFHTDHMLSVNWNSNSGWDSPLISKFQNIEVHPFASGLHYAISVFEGLKAYKDSKNNIRLFRPDCNMYRLKVSSHRLSLPDFDGNELLEAIKALLRVEKNWVPNKEGFSAYIRPLHYATEQTLGVRAPSMSQLLVTISPVGPYYPTGFSPVKLYCDKNIVRSPKGGVGEYKAGSNYGPTIKISQASEKKGYQQNLWILPSGQIQEIGTSNLFLLWKNKQNELELITPKLDGTILPGVTRDSVLRICREWNEFKVTERDVYMDELLEAIAQKRLIEGFGAGTAVIVNPVCKIGYDGKDYDIPLVEELKAGKLTKRLFDTIINIQYGQIEHPFSTVI